MEGKVTPCSPSWRKLDLSVNNIDSLAAFNASKCGKLTELVLVMNKLNFTLTTNTFAALPNLERLNLSHNQIRMLRGSPFLGLKKLQAFDLSHNYLRVLSKTTFRDLASLEVLRLFGNFIGFIEKSTFASLVRLQSLDLTQNNLTRFRTDSFRGLASLQHLYLQRNPLQELEPKLFSEMTNLKTLQLGICGRIGEVRRLEGNHFTKLARLQVFNFSFCKMVDIHMDAFKGLTSLQRLSLRGNRLARINGTVWEPLVELTFLDLAGNALECLYDANFQPLARLIELDLSTNRLSFLSDGAFEGLTGLQRLNLAGNPLRTVQPGAFCRAEKLFRLDLQQVRFFQDLELGPPGSNGSLNASLVALPKAVTILLPPPRSARGLGLPCRPLMPGRVPNACPVYVGPDAVDQKAHSRQYLLISVAVCVAFLLMALGVIMSYRAWSKRKRTACEKAEAAALEEEKQEMMAKPANTSQPANGATKELLAAGQSAENGVVLHERSPKEEEGAKEGEEEESTMTHLAVV